MRHSVFSDVVSLSCVSITAKAGECPSTKSGAGMCAELCYYDSDCPNNEKCCSNGCGHQCMDPFAGIYVIILVFGSASSFQFVLFYN